MNNQIDLPPEDIILLDAYKCIESGKPINKPLTIEDLSKLKDLSEEIKQAEKEDAPKLEKINKLNEIIQEKRIQLETLQAQLDKRLLYLKQESSVKPVKEVNHNASVSLSPINETTVLETLKANVYGLGNAEICRKLGLTGNKAEQNKAYSVAKGLEAKGLVKSENRMWKAV